MPVLSKLCLPFSKLPKLVLTQKNVIIIKGKKDADRHCFCGSEKISISEHYQQVATESPFLPDIQASGFLLFPIDLPCNKNKYGRQWICPMEKRRYQRVSNTFRVLFLFEFHALKCEYIKG